MIFSFTAFSKVGLIVQFTFLKSPCSEVLLHVITQYHCFNLVMYVEVKDNRPFLEKIPFSFVSI